MTPKDITAHRDLIGSVLRKNNLNPLLPATRYTGGQINFVYQVGDDFVLKIERDLDVTPHQESIVKLAVEAGAKVPKILDAGNIAGRRYLLMERLRGEKLSHSWHTFSEDQKESFINQICEQMKILHSIKFDNYSPQRPREFDNFLEAIEWQMRQINIDQETLDNTTKTNLDLIKQFYQDHKEILDERGTAVFVHNDLHFENILFEREEITGIIDFDFSRQFPKDYELWHIVDFFFAPTYYVEKKLEPMWMNFQLGNELNCFKKYYPDLFNHPHLLTRLRLYFLDQMLGDLQDGAIYKMNERVEAYFRGGWLETYLEYKGVIGTCREKLS